MRLDGTNATDPDGTSEEGGKDEGSHRRDLGSPYMAESVALKWEPCATARDHHCSPDDLTKLACLWSQEELCGRRPAKIDPFEWACHENNIDSFMLFTRLKRLPKVPTFAQAVMQQRQVVDDEAREAERRRSTVAQGNCPANETKVAPRVSKWSVMCKPGWLNRHRPDATAYS